MAKSKSVKKRIQQDARKRLHNRTAKSALRTSIKKFRTAASAGDASAAALFKTVQKQADKLAAKGIMRRGTGARIKSRLAATLAKAQAKKSS